MPKAAGAEQVLDLDGTPVRVTSADKVFFAERGETKLDLVEHYVRVGEPLMRAMGGRPVLMQRFPNGAEGPVVLPEAGAEGRPRMARRRRS